MKKMTSTILLLVTMISTGSIALADDGPAGAACGLAGCGIFGLVYILMIAAAFAIPVTIIILVIRWIKSDAVAHGMPNADSIKWLGLLGLLGLLIYLLQRPQVPVMLCPSCGKNRMQGLPACPHCGNP